MDEPIGKVQFPLGEAQSSSRQMVVENGVSSSPRPHFEVGSNKLKHTRCEYHGDREAAARCPECSGFFCRECVTEHNGRMLCLKCLRKNLDSLRGKGKGLGFYMMAAAFLISMMSSWYFFFQISVFLASIPQKYHDGSVVTGQASTEKPRGH